MNPPLRIRLTGRAQRFLALLVDFGHLDETRVDELLVTVAEMGVPGQETAIDLPVVRRVAAIFLFGNGHPEALVDIEMGILAEDWPFLFS